MPSCQAHATAAPLPFSNSTSVDAWLHTLCGGQQSSCFTSAILPSAGASTTNTRVPSPRELRTVAWMASGAATGCSAMLPAEAERCIRRLRLWGQQGRRNDEQAMLSKHASEFKPKGFKIVGESHTQALLSCLPAAAGIALEHRADIRISAFVIKTANSFQRCF
jgi:hypothetical protein